MSNKTGPMVQSEPCFIGFRKLQNNGGSVVVSLPADALNEEFDVDPEDLVGESASVRLDDDGSYRVSLTPLVER